MDALSTTQAAHLDPRVWGEAYEHVEDHLRSYRIRNRLLLARLTEAILARAARRLKEQPDGDPSKLATEEVGIFMRGWIDALVGPSDESAEDRFARGRVALHLTGLPEAFPEAFLHPEDTPAGLADQIRNTYMEAGPDLAFTNMAPRPIDLGPVSEIADETWRTFAKWPLLRATLLWSLLAGLLGLSFYITRF